jgi:hypothetical protein
MTDNQPELDVMFYQLILSMQASVMQHLGKVMSPMSGDIERNLDAAKYSIDILDMIKRKTEGNLSDDESKMLEHVLYQLRMNYVEEVKKGDDAGKPDEAGAGESAPDSGPSEDAGEPESPKKED